jgi:hypothetical protein
MIITQKYNNALLKYGVLTMTDLLGFLTTKIVSMVGGMFGGAAILTFIRPASIVEAFVRGGISAGSAVVFSAPLLEVFQMHSTWENQLMSGFCIGFVAYSILGMIANFLAKNQTRDVLEVIKDIKNTANDTKKE